MLEYANYGEPIVAEAITKAEFTQRLADDELVLAFAGMSGSGKSWSAKKLALENGFDHLDCDAKIGEVLRPILESEGYYRLGEEYVTAVGNWMGQPPAERFPAREEEYVRLEEQEMTKILDKVEAGVDSNTVIDTTGSIAHVPQDIRDRLGKIATIVVFDITPDMRPAIFEEYKNGDPKPVVWEGKYVPKRGESPDKTLKRCYFDLLDHREGIYHDMTKLIIPRQVKFGFPDQAALLAHIHNALPE